MYHAQPRFGLQRISGTDHGKPGAAVHVLAGFRARLEAQADRRRDSVAAPISPDLTLTRAARLS